MSPVVVLFRYHPCQELAVGSEAKAPYRLATQVRRLIQKFSMLGTAMPEYYATSFAMVAACGKEASIRTECYTPDWPTEVLTWPQFAPGVYFPEAVTYLPEPNI